jgi:hypothetical protein
MQLLTVTSTLEDIETDSEDVQVGSSSIALDAQ